MAPRKKYWYLEDNYTFPYEKLNSLDHALHKLDSRLQHFDVTMRAHRMMKLDSNLYSLEYKAHALDFRMRIMRNDLMRYALGEQWVSHFDRHWAPAQDCEILIRFRISYTFSFDFVWWCPSSSIGNVWTFVELQLTALSALAPTQGIHKLIGVGLDKNYTGNPLTNSTFLSPTYEVWGTVMFWHASVWSLFTTNIMKLPGWIYM